MRKADRHRFHLSTCALLSASLLLVLVHATPALSACSCGTGKMMNWLPGSVPVPGMPPATGNAPVSIDGLMSDWDNIITSPNNNICDGSPGSAIADLDAPIQSTGRDLMQFTYTFDSNYVYAYTQRYASSSNTDNFIYYADTNNNGVMENGEAVIVVAWQGSNRSVSVRIGTYQAANPAGDAMTCTTATAGGQSCTAEFADGYHLPGTVINLPSSGNANYSGKWGSDTGTEMEWRVSWTDLGMAATPGTPFTFHVSSTNAQPGAGSFPAQVDDNMGGCGGKAGTTQYGGVALAPDQLVTLGPATSYTVGHTLTNTGNGNDNFTLSYTVSGSNNPLPTVTYFYNGQPFTDTSTLGSSFTLAAGESIPITAMYSFPSSPATKSYSVTTAAKSKFDANVKSAVIDTLTSQEAVTISSNTTGGYGTFSYSGGTNGLPASLTLTSTAGNNPVVSPGYVINPAQGATITQNANSGWIFDRGSCSYFGAGTAVNPLYYTFTNNAGSVALNINKAAFTGESINCTFYNLRLPTIAVSKLLGDLRVSDTDQFVVKLLSGPTVISSSATTGSGGQVTSGTGSVSYTPSGTGAGYSILEAMAAGSATPPNVYAAALRCYNNGVLQTVPGVLGEAFTPGIGDNYVCYVTNTPPSMKVQAQSASYPEVFGFSGNNGISATFSLDTSVANPAVQAFVLAAVNTETSVTETTLPTGWRVKDITCTDALNNPVPSATIGNRSVTIPASAVVAGARFTCTFANAIYPPHIVITKTSDKTSAVCGEVVTYSSEVTNWAGLASGVVLTDKLSPYTAFGLNSYGAGVPFHFQDGGAASGTSLGTPLYSRNNGASWDYVPVSGGGGAPDGFDANVTDWKIPMIGTMNDWPGGASAYPSFTVKYKVITR